MLQTRSGSSTDADYTQSGIRSGCFLIRCVNTCPQAPAEEKSSKQSEGHGYGKEIIRSICRKYDGEYTLKYADGNAVATVMLRLRADPVRGNEAA